MQKSRPKRNRQIVKTTTKIKSKPLQKRTRRQHTTIQQSSQQSSITNPNLGPNPNSPSTPPSIPNTLITTSTTQPVVYNAAGKAIKQLPSDVIVTNPTFSAPALIDHDVHKIHDGPLVVTEDNLLEKIHYEAKVKDNRMYRFSEKARDNQPQIRAAILAIPAALTMWACHDLSMYLASVSETFGYDVHTTSNLLMGLGAFQAFIGYQLFTNANQILHLAGQPTEPVIQDIIRRTFRQKDLHDVVGSHIKIGHFVSVSTHKGGPRWVNSKAKHYQEWLANDTQSFTTPSLEVPFPKITQKILNLFPVFKSTPWSTAVSEHVAHDLMTNPNKYLPPMTSPITPIMNETNTTSTSSSTNTTTTTPTDTNTSQQQDQLISSEQLQQQSIQEQEVENPYPTLFSRKPKDEIEPQSEQARRVRKSRVGSYSGWERYWKPKRLQFTAHIVGVKDEGLLLCEVEKLNFGTTFRQSGGNTNYRIFQFISFKTGKVTNLDQQARPSLLSHAHIEKLFDTIPISTPIPPIMNINDEHPPATPLLLTAPKLLLTGNDNNNNNQPTTSAVKH